MNNVKLLGYIMGENLGIQVKPKIVSKTDKTITFDTVLQEGNKKNRNGRIYPSVLIESGFNSPFVRERLITNSWFGEAEHPMEDDPKRLVRLDRVNSCHIIRSWSRTGDIFNGRIQTTANTRGREMMDMILENDLITGFSLRGFGPVKKTDTGDIVVQPFRMITYDGVTHPSHNPAYMCNTLSESSKMVPIYESTLNDLFKQESALMESFDCLNLFEHESDCMATENGNLIVKNKDTTIMMNVSESTRFDLIDIFNHM